MRWNCWCGRGCGEACRLARNGRRGSARPCAQARRAQRDLPDTALTREPRLPWRHQVCRQLSCLGAIIFLTFAGAGLSARASASSPACAETDYSATIAATTPSGHAGGAGLLDRRCDPCAADVDRQGGDLRAAEDIGGRGIDLVIEETRQLLSRRSLTSMPGAMAVAMPSLRRWADGFARFVQRGNWYIFFRSQDLSLFRPSFQPHLFSSASWSCALVHAP